MTEPATMKLELRLAPTAGEPNAEVLDDLVKLIRQAVATAPPDSPDASTEDGFRSPEPDEQKSLRGLESRIKHRIEQAVGTSEKLIGQREAVTAQPDATAKLADEAVHAANAVVAAVQRAKLRGVIVTTPSD